MKYPFSAFFTLAMMALALIGFIAVLTDDASRFFQTLFFITMFAFIIYLIIRYFVVPKNFARKEQLAFRKAVRDSRKRMKKKMHAEQKQLKKRNALRNKDYSHLKVIEGKKGKKNKEA